VQKNILKIICSILLVIPSFASADQAVSGLESSGTPKTSGTYTTPQPSVKDSSDKSASDNKSGQMMSYLMGGMFIATGTPMVASCPESAGTCAMGVMLIGMGILSFKQGDSHGKSAGQSGVSAYQSNGYGSDPYATGDTNPASTDASVIAAQNQLKKLEQAGMIDTKTGTIKVPGGKTYNASDFADAASMAAAGFPPGAVSGALAAADRAEKAARSKADKLMLGAMTASNGYAEGGGGAGGAGGGAGGADGLGAYGAGGAGAGKAGGLNRDPAQVAGMQKNFNGEPIGVAADSIFLMMNRRYKVKESQDSFFTDMDLRLRK
jgi:hypothetical protein